MSKEKLIVPFNARLDITKTYEEADKQYVEGYAATTDYDDQGDVITKEAIKQSENDLLERSTVLFNHDKERPIGKVEEANGDEKGLKIKVLVSKAEPDIWQKIKEGVINKFSIRGSILESTKEKVKDAGKEIWANVIKAMKLIEVSMVSIPANSNAKTLAWYMSKALNENNEAVKTEEEYKKQIEDLNKLVLELKGYSIVNGVMQPTSYLRCYSNNIKGLRDRKLGQDIMIKAKGSIKSMETDDDYGDSCTVNLSEGELLEVEKQMADIKKKDGTLYTQEEVDTLVAKQEGTEKALSDSKIALESKDVETKKSIDDANAKIVDIQKKHDDISKELETVKKERDDMKSKQADEDINKKVEVKWADLEGKSYKKEDAVVIKSILKKGFLAQALSPEETDALITKKISGSILKLGFEPIMNSGEITKERKEVLVKFAGIKIKK